MIDHHWPTAPLSYHIRHGALSKRRQDVWQKWPPFRFLDRVLLSNMASALGDVTNRSRRAYEAKGKKAASRKAETSRAAVAAFFHRDASQLHGDATTLVKLVDAWKLTAQRSEEISSQHDTHEYARMLDILENAAAELQQHEQIDPSEWMTIETRSEYKDTVAQAMELGCHDMICWLHSKPLSSSLELKKLVRSMVVLALYRMRLSEPESYATTLGAMQAFVETPLYLNMHQTPSALKEIMMHITNIYFHIGKLLCIKRAAHASIPFFRASIDVCEKFVGHFSCDEEFQLCLSKRYEYLGNAFKCDGSPPSDALHCFERALTWVPQADYGMLAKHATTAAFSEICSVHVPRLYMLVCRHTAAASECGMPLAEPHTLWRANEPGTESTNAVGIIKEMQLHALVSVAHRRMVSRRIRILCNDLLSLYNAEAYPVRHARVMAQTLHIMAAGIPVGIEPSLDAQSAEQTKDEHLACFQKSYQIQATAWSLFITGTRDPSATRKLLSKLRRDAYEWLSRQSKDLIKRAYASGLLDTALATPWPFLDDTRAVPWVLGTVASMISFIGDIRASVDLASVIRSSAEMIMYHAHSGADMLADFLDSSSILLYTWNIHGLDSRAQRHIGKVTATLSRYENKQGHSLDATAPFLLQKALFEAKNRGDEQPEDAITSFNNAISLLPDPEAHRTRSKPKSVDELIKHLDSTRITAHACVVKHLLIYYLGDDAAKKLDHVGELGCDAPAEASSLHAVRRLTHLWEILPELVRKNALLHEGNAASLDRYRGRTLAPGGSLITGDASKLESQKDSFTQDGLVSSSTSNAEFGLTIESSALFTAGLFSRLIFATAKTLFDAHLSLFDIDMTAGDPTKAWRHLVSADRLAGSLGARERQILTTSLLVRMDYLARPQFFTNGLHAIERPSIQARVEMLCKVSQHAMASLSQSSWAAGALEYVSSQEAERAQNSKNYENHKSSALKFQRARYAAQDLWCQHLLLAPDETIQLPYLGWLSGEATPLPSQRTCRHLNLLQGLLDKMSSQSASPAKSPVDVTTFLSMARSVHDVDVIQRAILKYVSRLELSAKSVIRLLDASIGLAFDNAMLRSAADKCSRAAGADQGNDAAYWKLVHARHSTRARNLVCDRGALPSWASLVTLVYEDEQHIWLTYEDSQGKPIALRQFVASLDGLASEFERIVCESNETIREGDKFKKEPMGDSARHMWWARRYKLDEDLAQCLHHLESEVFGAYRRMFAKMRPTAASLAMLYHELLRLNPSLDVSHEHLALLFTKDMAAVDIDELAALLGISSSYRDRLIQLSRRIEVEHSPHHVFFCISGRLSSLPWERMPCLSGRSVSRELSVASLYDHLDWLRLNRSNVSIHGAQCVVNPDGDLGKMEERLRPWASSLETSHGWSVHFNETGTSLSDAQLFVYFGHGAGSQVPLDTAKLRCPASLLWGCASAAMPSFGSVDGHGPAEAFITGGSPMLLGMLWDTTDRDMDLMAASVMYRCQVGPRINISSTRTAMGGSLERFEQLSVETPIDVCRATALSRDQCVLKYLNGGAPVIYGLPLTLGD